RPRRLPPALEQRRQAGGYRTIGQSPQRRRRARAEAESLWSWGDCMETESRILRTGFNDRLRLHDGMLVRTLVEGVNNQGTRPAFKVDVTERRKRESMVRLEVVEQAALRPVGENLIVHVQEDLLGQRFHLKAHLIVNAGRGRD